MAGVMADEDARAQRLQPLGVGAGLRVRAVHRVADAQHDLGDAAHADAADADEMDRAELERNGTAGGMRSHGRPIANRGRGRKAVRLSRPCARPDRPAGGPRPEWPPPAPRPSGPPAPPDRPAWSAP